VTTDHAFYLRRVATVPFELPGGREIASRTAAMAADGTDCLVLSHHGCVVLADTVELAHKRARNFEEAAQLTYRAVAAGRLDDLRGCPDEFVARLADPTTLTV
jgi:ribulose-5-phosphate 4-epimerase/fuculose-1-phosphate aldolase